MPESFHLTAWLRRHPLTVLLLAATICVDVVGSLFPDSQPQRVTVVALAFSQIGLLAICAGMSDRWRLYCALSLVPAIALSIWLIGEEGQHDYWLLFTMLSIHAVLIVIFTWLLQLLANKNRLALRFSVKQLFAVTAIVAFLAMAWTYAIPLTVGSFMAVANSASLAIIATLAFTFLAVPRAYVALMVIVFLFLVTLDAMGSSQVLDILVPFNLIQALVYSAWLGVARSERR